MLFFNLYVFFLFSHSVSVRFDVIQVPLCYAASTVVLGLRSEYVVLFSAVEKKYQHVFRYSIYAELCQFYNFVSIFQCYAVLCAIVLNITTHIDCAFFQ